MRVAVVGAGYIAQVHLEVLRGIRGVEVVGCYDQDPWRAQRLAHRWGVRRCCESLPSLLDERPEVVHVLVPPDHHVEVSHRVVEAGAHVFVEKPMGIRAEECERLIHGAAQHGVQLGVNHNAIFHPLFLRLQEDLRRGRLGRIRHVALLQSGPLGQLDAGRFSHWMFRHPGNVVFEQAVHPVSQVLRLLGKPRELRAEVSGRRELGVGQVFYERWRALAECEGGTASLELLFGSAFYPQSHLLVVGQDGVAFVDLRRGLYLVQEKSVLPEFLDDWLCSLRHVRCLVQGAGAAFRYLLSKAGLHPRSDLFFLSVKNSIEAFYRALREGRNPPVGGEEGREAVAFCERWVEAAALPSVPLRPRPALRKAPEVLVSGANGFIGAHLVEALTTRGVGVRALVRSQQGLKPPLVSPLVELKVGDLLDPGVCEEAVQGVRCVYHLAHGGGESWDDFWRANVAATEQLARASLEEGVRYFAFASTIAVYCYRDLPRGVPLTEQMPLDAHPERRNHYARSKILAERLLQEMARREGLPVVIFRPGIVLGRWGTIYHGGIGQWMRDNACAFWGWGRSELPLVLAEDVAGAMARLMEREGLEGEAFNLVGDVRLSAREYVEELRRLLGRRIRGFPVPISALFALDLLKYVLKTMTNRRAELMLSYRDLANRAIPARFDCSKAKQLLGWRPCADREEFLRKAVGWAVR